MTTEASTVPLPRLAGIRELVGHERSVTGVSQALHHAVRELHAPIVGAMHVTCSDETETECAQAFLDAFVRYLLPPIKFGHQSAFRLANLGGQYEWGSAGIADSHFAAAGAGHDSPLMVVKVNSHVAIRSDGSEPQFGMMQRYGKESPCCEAMHALLDGSHQPFADQLRDSFLSEGKHRIVTLLDEARVPPNLRMLFASIVNARMQARKAVLDIQDLAARSRTRFLVVPAVTINRPERDTEILVGVYWVDTLQEPCRAGYFGLGDDPAEYHLEVKNRLCVVRDSHVGNARHARDHRRIAKEFHEKQFSTQPKIQDARLRRVQRDAEQNRAGHHKHGRSLLRALLPILAELTPVSAATLLFAHGLAGIHHVFRVHTLTRDLEDSEEAQQILDEIHDRVDRLSPEHAQAMVELLTREYLR